jgi:Tol biopolymer transport system component
MRVGVRRTIGRTLLGSGVVTMVLAASVLAASPAHATFPGGDGKLAYIEPDPSGCSAGSSLSLGPVWVANSDGSSPSEVAPGCFAYPRWSADGRYLAFDDATHAVIWDSTNNTTRSRGLTYGGGASFGGVAWSPDGQYLAYADRAGISKLAVGGGGSVLIARHPHDRFNFYRDDSPVWSPDGTTIAFAELIAANQSLDNMQYLEKVNVATGTRSALGPRCDFSYRDHPDYGPDGNSVVFTYGQNGEGCKPRTAGLYELNLTSHQVTRLTTNGMANNPVFEPNLGQHILFDDGTDIFNMPNAPGATATLVTAGIEPDWQPVPV